ncbi:MAG: ABC transporter ATP-binding protein [Planctomycetes bacterium]|nr:ABC transporter ATP-binding protein [Planctomycetota bacterium]
MHAIEISDLTIAFGDFVAVDAVRFDVEEGEIFGFLGPNGSGKTTLIKALCGLLTPHSGSARLLGLDVARDVDDVRAQVGYMSQRFSLYEDLTAEENIDFYAGVYGLDLEEREGRKRDLLALTHLEPYLDRRAGLLSGGWKQRLALVCSMIHGPRLLFLDEPTAGIDPVARRELWDLLFELSAQGVTLFVTTHYMDEAERCARVGYIFLSHLLAVGTPEELKRLPEITPPGHCRIEISSATPGRVLKRMLGAPGVSEATLHSESVHAILAPGGTPEALAAEVHGWGFADAVVRESRPTLEDVFVTLTRRRMADGANGNTRRTVRGVKGGLEKRKS